jgi:hypothetical protein
MIKSIENVLNVFIIHISHWMERVAIEIISIIVDNHFNILLIILLFQQFLMISNLNKMRI